MRQGRTARNAHLAGAAARPTRRAARLGKGRDMADQSATEPAQGTEPGQEPASGTEPGQEPGGGAQPDYKALYEAAKANSRKWEKQAKANKDAAAALGEANQAKKTAEEQIAELTKRLDDKEKAEQRATVAAKVAKEKGVPADLIVGDDEESMADWADKMLAAFKTKPAPRVEKPGSFAKDDGKDRTELRDFASALLGNKQ